jgi:hypothetical protein
MAIEVDMALPGCAGDRPSALRLRQVWLSEVHTHDTSSSDINVKSQCDEPMFVAQLGKTGRLVRAALDRLLSNGAR